MTLLKKSAECTGRGHRRHQGNEKDSKNYKIPEIHAQPERRDAFAPLQQHEDRPNICDRFEKSQRPGIKGNRSTSLATIGVNRF